VLAAGRERFRSTLAVLALAAAIAVATAAGQWLPTVELARRGVRLALSEEVRGFWSLHPWLVPQILAPLSWRALPEYSPRTVELFEAWEPFLRSLYLGAPALALVLAGLALPRAPWRGRLAVLAVGAFLLALGRHTPLYALVTAALPPLALIRYPAKMAVLTALAWSLLAAMGAEAWGRRSEIAPRRWVSRVLAPCLVVALLLGGAAVVAWTTPLATVQRVLQAPDPAAASAAIVAPAARVLALASTLLLAALLFSRVRSRWGGTLVAALVIADLLWAHRGLNPSAPAAFYRYRPEILRTQTVRPGQRVYALEYSPSGGRPSRHPLAGAFMDVQPGYAPAIARALGLQTYLYPPTSARWAVYGSFDRDLLGLTPRAIFDLRAAVANAEDGPGYPMLVRLGAVDVVVALHELGAPFAPLGEFHDAPLRLPTRAFRVPDALPRTYVVTHAVGRSGSEDLRPFVTGELDPRSAVIVEAEETAPPLDGAVARMAAIDERPDRLRAEVEANAAGWLVWVNTYDPGWRADLDGGSAPVLRANHAFMAIAFPPGRHVVELRYRPPSVFAGLLLSVSGLAAGLTLVARSPRP
jgi:Bacterial membrane protein YfhO